MAGLKQNLVGDRIRKLRTVEGISQDALAAKCQAAGWDISRGTFAKIEAGLRRVNDAEVVVLAKVLNRDVSDLLGGFSLKKAIEVSRHGDTTG
ncbi:helix-turn-helix transcriptional regulator [Luteolibacter sp. SL250]|uniref:helix-turn-helix domain-containing protein n=1 Tax=Luteolibacter sp. SL250 TaxID=2995170 RepID=UPI00227208CE|nr:helix-turn-helix transcriptional regulator [Luteolibacter sp. SL250]WAC21100.1 helix-turn-helix transcriptional regulator [Luteolibacter sp. SL250]